MLIISALKEPSFKCPFFFVFQFLKIKVAVYVIILSGSVDKDAVLFVLVAKQRKLSFCCLVCSLMTVRFMSISIC